MVKYKQTKVVLGKIDQVRLYKRALLPYEVVGLKGNKLTICDREKEAKSPIKWDFLQKNYPTPERICFNAW